MKICPEPAIWFSVFERLQDFAHKNSCEPRTPPFPLILNGWAFSNDVHRRERWEATVAWANANGCPELVTDLSDAEFYCVDTPTNHVVGPLGGPMHREWDYQQRSKPDPALLESALNTLKERWSAIVGEELSRPTIPIWFAGAKRRRLVVLADEKESPPWGTWSSLSADESKRREFTKFRAAINLAIAPHEVDHIDFILPVEVDDAKSPGGSIIRLAEVDPTGTTANALIVRSLQMWVRCFWPDLAAMKREDGPGHEPILKDGKITSPFRVYELRGKIIALGKRYDDAQEVKIHVSEATDITAGAQEVLNRAKALHDRHGNWPADDEF